MQMLFGVKSFLNLCSLAISLYLFKITCMNCHCTLYKRNLYQYIKKYEYLHVLPIFSNFVFMTKDQMTGGILFLSCLSVVNINIRYNCLTICDRDFIWHAYSTNKALSNDSDIYSEKKKKNF